MTSATTVERDLISIVEGELLPLVVESEPQILATPEWCVALSDSV